MTGVFINYRSADGRVAAEAVYRDLTAAFGDGYVFLDKRAISPGVPYPAKIRTWIRERCSVMIAVIGPGWLSAADADGNRLLFRPNDWVHDEIADAQKMPEKKAAALLESMGKDRALPILCEMRPYRRWAIMTRLPPDFRHEAQKGDYHASRQEE